MFLARLGRTTLQPRRIARLVVRGKPRNTPASYSFFHATNVNREKEPLHKQKRRRSKMSETSGAAVEEGVEKKANSEGSGGTVTTTEKPVEDLVDVSLAATDRRSLARGASDQRASHTHVNLHMTGKSHL